MGIVETHGQKSPLPIEDNGQITGCAFTALLANRASEQPGMALLESSFSRRLDADSDILVCRPRNVR
jgi:hypothetical protein